MNDEQLLEIEARANGATSRVGKTVADAVFDQHSQADVLALVAEVRRLRAMLAPLAESLLTTARRNGVREQDTIDVGRLATSLSELRELLTGSGERPDTTSSRER